MNNHETEKSYLLIVHLLKSIGSEVTEELPQQVAVDY